jgi:hypothetical protein
MGTHQLVNGFAFGTRTIPLWRIRTENGTIITPPPDTSLLLM